MSQPPYLSPPYFRQLSGSLSAQPPACSPRACGEAGLQGLPLFWSGEKSPERALEIGEWEYICIKQRRDTVSLSVSFSKANISETALFQKQ